MFEILIYNLIKDLNCRGNALVVVSVIAFVGVLNYVTLELSKLYYAVTGFKKYGSRFYHALLHYTNR
ncbi:MAG: hypothetical protein K1X29_07355 [Bdellovibrionales bacterium]|nr:hypothetical protein [Bdellovibrionales bacterium]